MSKNTNSEFFYIFLHGFIYSLQREAFRAKMNKDKKKSMTLKSFVTIDLHKTESYLKDPAIRATFTNTSK